MPDLVSTSVMSRSKPTARLTTTNRPTSRSRRRGRFLLQLDQRLLEPLDQAPDVTHLFTVRDDPDVDMAVVAHGRDVESHAVGDDGHRVVREQPGTGAVERELRAGHVGDHEVPLWPPDAGRRK